MSQVLVLVLVFASLILVLALVLVGLDLDIIVGYYYLFHPRMWLRLSHNGAVRYWIYFGTPTRPVALTVEDPCSLNILIYAEK